MESSDSLSSVNADEEVENPFLRILIATDIHLGYSENHKTLSDDSFNTFEEILQVANSRNVDMILLGGDLFHDPKPSINSLNRCTKLLRTYVLGDKTIDFEFLSDTSQNFQDSFSRTVNYEDANLNVAIPVFSIHGNHDDISGTGRLSPMDLLSSMGFINYFGKWRDLSEVEIYPIIIQKKDTKVAIYGLSHIHDARLARLFRDHKVNVRKTDINDEEIFNMMVLHQNRANRGRFNYVREDQLPGFMNFILWGHEHDCRIDETASGSNKPRICQPGSSVATSLSEGEAIEKKIGILDILETKPELTAIPLKTVRPFIFRSVLIEDFVDELRLNEGDIRKKVEKFYCKNVDEMIEEARQRLSGHPKQPTLPLIRLRIVFSNQDHVLNITQFGQKFEGKVANTESILAFKKNIKRQKQEVLDANNAAIDSAYYKKKKQDCVEDVVESYFNELIDDNDKLKIFSLKSLTEVCRLLVEKGDEQGVNTIFEKVYTNANAFMSEKMCDEESIAEAIEEFQSKKSKETFDEAVIENSRSSVQPDTNMSNVIDEDFDNGGPSSSFKAPVVRRGGAGGKAAASDQSSGLNVKKGNAKRATSRAVSNSFNVRDSDDSD